MDKDIESSFALIDAYMTRLFYSGLTKEQTELVKDISKEIARLHSLVESKS